MKLNDNGTIDAIERSQEPIKKIPMKIGSNIVLSYLVNEMYKNQKLIPVQEILSNAWDIHKRTNQSKAIEVHLPTITECFFSVKDFGTGLNPSPETMAKFGDFGISDKNESDDEAGGYGLGSKAPFALVDSYLVISRYNGEKHTFSFELDRTIWDFSMNLIASEPTDEPNGLEVLFSIDPKDINDIITYYHRTVSFWDVQPIVVNAADLYYNRQEYENLLEKAIHINKDLFVIESQFVPKSLGDKSYGQTSIFFIISGIPYKCPSNYLTEKILRFSSNYCIFFRISTKTVKPSTDRENIRITDFNHKNILIHFESIYQQLVTYLHDEKLKLQEKCTFEQAILLHFKKLAFFPKSDGGLLEGFHRNFKVNFNEESILVNFGSEHLELINSTDMYNLHFSLEAPSRYSRGNSSDKKLMTGKWSNKISLPKDALKINTDFSSLDLSYYQNTYFYNDTILSDIKIKRIIKHHLETTGKNRFKLIENKIKYNYQLNDISDERKEELLKIVSFLGIKSLSTLEIPKAPIKKKPTDIINKDGFYILDLKDTWGYHGLKAKQSIDFSSLDTSNTFYISIIKKGMNVRNNDGNFPKIRNYYHFLTKMNITLIGLSSKQLDSMKKNKIQINHLSYLFDNLSLFPNIFNLDNFNAKSFIFYKFYNDIKIPQWIETFRHYVIKNDNYKHIPNKQIKETLDKLNTIKDLSEHTVKTYTFHDSKYDIAIEAFLMAGLKKPPVDPVSISKDIAMLEEKYSFIKGYRFDFVNDEESIKFLKLLK